jgi:hypothetical protein
MFFCSLFESNILQLKLFFHIFFRGFIQERAWQKEQGKPVGETHLYFGCRNKDKGQIISE